MADRPKMPVPAGEMTPQELSDRIRDWALEQGYDYESAPHGGEFGKIILRDPNGGHTITVVPNAHRGRRLRKNQVRYTVKGINQNWED
jgi:hypothetical protein